MIKNIFLLVALPLISFAQKHDYNWFAGEYDSAPGPPSNFVLDFNTYPPQVVGLETNYFYSNTQHSMSDYAGQFLYYSNGCSLFQYIDPVGVAISENMNGNDFLCSVPSNHSMNIQHGIMALPLPNERYILFSYEMHLNDVHCFLEKMIYHAVDFSTTPGTMLQQDVVLKEGCFNVTMANKHGNGRDWWIVAIDSKEHKFYTWLLSPQGLTAFPDQQLAEPLPSSVPSWGEFSPDGNHIAVAYPWAGTGVYDFDRCNGTVSNFRLVAKPTQNEYLTFSPDSRYIYTMDSGHLRLLQYDLYATDLANSEIIIDREDSYLDTLYSSRTYFGCIHKGPDGKVYQFAGNTRYMNVMDFPNRAGVACRFRQRAIMMESPTYAANAYYPNYRLGPIDGSACDTLGIDNIPLAMYHHDVEDTLSPLSVTFTDASYYLPTAWQWDFGDGGTSTEQHPVHAFAAPGTYTVCLVALNPNGSDTLCREVAVSAVSGTVDLAARIKAMVSPNPVGQVLRVVLPAQLPGHVPVFRLADALGRTVLEGRLDGFERQFSVGHLPKGLYFWEVASKGVIWDAGKLVKVE